MSVFAHDRTNPLATDDIRPEELQTEGAPPPIEPPDWLAWGQLPLCGIRGWGKRPEAVYWVEGWFALLVGTLPLKDRALRWQCAAHLCNTGAVDPHAIRALYRLDRRAAREAMRIAAGLP